MASRMEKYFEQSNTNTRTRRNTKLYDEMYSGTEYTNVEGIATLEKIEDIDLEKIKSLLKENNADVNNKKITRKGLPVLEEYEEEYKNYDLNEVLTKAKDEREDFDNKSRVLKNTQYNILKNINISDFEKDETELKELINTITNTSTLNKMGDKELSLDLLNSLKSDNTQTITKNIKQLIKNEKDSIEETEMDKSFYTSSLGFDEKDFEELKNINHSLKKNNLLISVLVFILFASVISVILFVMFK